jgi:hypothetical protein
VTSATQEYWWVLSDILNVVSKRKSKWPFWELKTWLSNCNIIVLTAHINGMILRDVPVHKTWGITSLAGQLMLLGFNTGWGIKISHILKRYKK